MELPVRTREEQSVALALAEAIERGEIGPHYQPEIDLRDGTVVGIEALARWSCGGEDVPPETFVPIAEQHGLINDLTHCVLEQVAGCGARAAANGTALPLSVNVSAATVDDELVAVVFGALDLGRLDPHQLTVELTETTLFPGHEAARRSLSRLHRAGVRLSIDDFGIGWSSLAYLADLPVAELKIDRSFVQRLPHCHQIRCIVRRTIQLAADLGVTVIAEGVETEEQRSALLDLGCWHAQGFLMARPMPEAALWDWLEDRAVAQGPR
jgi:EAL domain-containing protein (putative c-di-GMP-specific phosphodiesterase class I)